MVVSSRFMNLNRSASSSLWASSGSPRDLLGPWARAGSFMS